MPNAYEVNLKGLSLPELERLVEHTDARVDIDFALRDLTIDQLRDVWTYVTQLREARLPLGVVPVLSSHDGAPREALTPPLPR